MDQISTETIATAAMGFFGVVGTFIMLVVKNRPIITFIKWVFNKSNRCTSDLKNHFIFFELQSWLDYQIDYKCNNVPCPIRGDMAKKFLHLRLELMEVYYHKLIDHIKDNALTFYFLADKKAEFDEEFAKQAETIGIPKIVIEKYKKFIAQSEIADCYLYERIVQYSHFKTDTDKLSAIFCVDLKSLYSAGKEVEAVIMELNGELDAYLGIECDC